MVTIDDKPTIKRLVGASGANEIWYEDLDMAAGTMAELNTSSGAIDTSDHLNMFEAFQKVFIVNGTNLKVADFLNIRIYDDTGFTNSPTRGSIVYQNGADPAQILVDYIDTTNKYLYGYVTTGTVQVATAITAAAGGAGLVLLPSPTSVSGMLTHAALATAHAATDTLTQAETDVIWVTATAYVVGDVILDTEEYICIVAHTSDVAGGDGTDGRPTGGGNTTQWTATVTATMVVEYTDAAKTHTWGQITAGVFDTDNLVSGDVAGTAFTPTATETKPPLWYDWAVYPGGDSGTMPTQAYLGCLYRGRLVLSGNSNYPHQWYMSKTANPWNWVYASTDPLSAVAGNNADAGEIGDIIRSLIPYKDEYLLFGCASSLWMLTGDPAGGGVISEVDLTVGMFGANSWCFDGEGNLYFWGTGGIYKSPLGFRSVENLTEIHLPDLLTDEDVDATSHRITMGYDIKRHGIVICITKLSDGTNSNYWYDLRLKGFFPETYPNECGAYSQYYYSANDNDLADLLVGCKDGYIRKFDNDKDDNIGNTTQLIDSYAVWPVQHLSEDNDKEGKLTSLTVELAGGGAGVPFSDTDGVTYEIHVADDAETLIENIISGDVPHSTGTLTGSGRKARIRARVRGAWLGLKFLNSTKSQTWAINRVYGVITPAGRIK